MYKLPFVFLIFMVSAHCHSQDQTPTEYNTPVYHNTVGDIPFDPELDDPNFTLCSKNFVSPQYYWNKLTYKGEITALRDHFETNFDIPVMEGQTGFLTIRFIVNCEGKTGRFRAYGVKRELESFDFQDSIVDAILDLTKALDGWEVHKYEDKEYHYYQYLTFELEDGQIKNISP